MSSIFKITPYINRIIDPEIKYQVFNIYYQYLKDLGNISCVTSNPFQKIKKI